MLTGNLSPTSIYTRLQSDAQIANVLTEDEARRIASNILKPGRLPLANSTPTSPG